MKKDSFTHTVEGKDRAIIGVGMPKGAKLFYAGKEIESNLVSFDENGEPISFIPLPESSETK